MTAQCEKCPFRGGVKVPSAGDPDKCKFVLIGEAPGRHEVVRKAPFVGETGRLLEAFLSRTNLELHSDDFYLMNALSCRVRSKKGVPAAVVACRPRVIEELEAINDDAVIVLMGANARDSLFPHEKGGVLAARGWRTWQGHDMYVMAHPSYYLYNPGQAPMLAKDIQRIARGRQPQIGPFELREGFRPVSINTEYVATILRTSEELQKLIDRLHGADRSKFTYLAFDLETDQVDWQRDRILCMSISTSEGTAFIIPDSLLYEDGREFYTGNWGKNRVKRFLSDERYKTASYLRPNPQTVMQLRELFAVPGYKWTGHNAKFDLKFLINYGVKNARCDFDTIVAHYTLDERRGGHGLKALADDYFDVGDYEDKLDRYLPKRGGRWSRVPRNILYKYNAMDTECSLRLARALKQELIDEGLLEWPFQEVLMRSYPMLLNAELTGVWIDWEEVDRIQYEELEPAIDKLKAELRELSGHPELNPLSSQQVIKIIYDELNFPEVQARTRAGGHKVSGRTTQKAMLDAWEKMHQLGTLGVSEEAWQFLVKLREFRHLRKLLGSYVRKWKKYRGTDNRVHTTYLLRGTVTGRLSATDPPLQTIPSKVTDRWGPMVANMHKAQPGWKLMYADYSQAELMVLAGLSGDELMLKTFKEGADYHSIVAEAAYGPDFTRDQRQASKKLTFGWAYGGDVKEIALDALQFDGAVANRFAGEWDKMFEGAVRWRAAQGEKMLEQGYVESIYGRRRRQILLLRKNYGKAMRVAINSPIQSAVSDFTLLSATRLYEHFKGCDYARVIMLIHDSLIMEVREDKLEEVKEVMHRIMIETPQRKFPDIPFRAEVKISQQLGDLT